MLAHTRAHTHAHAAPDRIHRRTYLQTQARTPMHVGKGRGDEPSSPSWRASRAAADPGRRATFHTGDGDSILGLGAEDSRQFSLGSRPGREVEEERSAGRISWSGRGAAEEREGEAEGVRSGSSRRVTGDGDGGVGRSSRSRRLTADGEREEEARLREGRSFKRVGKSTRRRDEAQAHEYAPGGDIEQPKRSPAVLAALSGRTLLRQVMGRKRGRG